MQKAKPRRRWGIVLLAFFCGIVTVGIAGAAVQITDQPAFCGQCHTMNSASWTHSISTHAQFDCNSCHTPSNLAAKLPYKAKIGMHDIFVTLTNSAPATIHSSDTMKDVIKANCIRCHESSISLVAMDVKPYCTDCHRSIPHNKTLPKAMREAADV